MAQDDTGRNGGNLGFEAGDAYPKAKGLLMNKGWNPAAGGALVLLKNWLKAQWSDLFDEFLPEPQDRRLEDWLDWRAEQAGG